MCICILLTIYILVNTKTRVNIVTYHSEFKD